MRCGVSAVYQASRCRDGKCVHRSGARQQLERDSRLANGARGAARKSGLQWVAAQKEAGPRERSPVLSQSVWMTAWPAGHLEFSQPSQAALHIKR